ncbi:diguanylate cyclase [Salipaludibacillus keqinensis]|uniref:Diguanylate cyclase n=1 Tax=Salipaludibacillus keqinensis TaxID=2045207 RepID=A0A323TPU6_9BACI|nr:dipeptidase [Salipaludibacillus keqinensis]PYZ94603.1 diguanylate cyclase [Salipaludibacillus keqinensis]
MKVFDLHCDALLKLHDDRKRSFTNHPALDVNLERLKEGNVSLQVFAIFVEPEIPSDEKFQTALEQIDLFHREVVGKHDKVKKISQWNDIHQLKEDEIGAMLSLEGADAFGNDLTKLRTLYQLGVKSVGLTWNNANLCADGLGEPRAGGLTELGFEVVALNNEHKVWTDVSHLSIRSFWDVLETAKYPIASHSNSKAICSHRRNLDDEQAKAIFRKNGLMGMVYSPPFVNNTEVATTDDLIKHIDHLCSIGGVEHIALGSDFDGVSTFVKDLDHSGKYQILIEELLKRFKEEEVRGFAYKNVLNCLPK